MSIYNETDPLDKQVRGDEHKRATSASTFLYPSRSQNSIQRRPGKQLTELISQDQVVLDVIKGGKQVGVSKWAESRARVQSNQKSGE